MSDLKKAADEALSRAARLIKKPPAVNSPLQGTHDAVVVHGSKPRLPVVHPARVERWHWVQNSKPSIPRSVVCIQWKEFAIDLGNAPANQASGRPAR